MRAPALRWKYDISPYAEETQKRAIIIAATDAFWALFIEKFESHFSSKEKVGIETHRAFAHEMDAAVYYEWIGIWDDTEAPPGLE